MTKAILVIDMPNHCGECACHVLGHEGYRYCCLSGHRLDDKNYCIERLDSCPLKPMPEKRLDVLDDDTWQAGWNACINDILGVENATE